MGDLAPASVAFLLVRQQRVARPVLESSRQRQLRYWTRREARPVLRLAEQLVPQIVPEQVARPRLSAPKIRLRTRVRARHPADKAWRRQRRAPCLESTRRESHISRSASRAIPISRACLATWIDPYCGNTKRGRRCRQCRPLIADQEILAQQSTRGFFRLRLRMKLLSKRCTTRAKARTSNGHACVKPFFQ